MYALKLQHNLEYSDRCIPLNLNLFNKTGDITGIFHLRIGTIKDRRSKDLREEEIRKTWQKYTEEWYKKALITWISQDSVVTLREPDILQCEVKLALRRFTMSKPNEGDGIRAELFQLLKDDTTKGLHSVC